MQHRQRGVVSVEFALIFPALFAIFYAIVTYGLIFAAQQALSLAAAEGGRATLRYQTADLNAADPQQNALSKRMEAAKTAAKAPLSWLQQLGTPGSDPVTVTATPTTPCYDASVTCVKVEVSYDYQAHPIVPRLMLPVPSKLGSSAVVQVNRSLL